MHELGGVGSRTGGEGFVPVVTLRRVDAADAEGIRDFYAGLSAESRMRRFMKRTNGISPARSRAYSAVDHLQSEGFVAVLRTAGPDDGRIVGHVCMDRAAQGAAELAIAVADEFQGRGLGGRLVEVALRWARARGLHRIVATACADNRAVLHLLRSAPSGARIWPAEGGLVDVEIAIPADLTA